MLSSPPLAAPSLAAVLDPVIPRVTAWLGQRPDALSLAQGMVHWGPPDAVLQTLSAALQQAGTDPAAAASLHRYGPGAGDPPLLAAIADSLQRQHGLDLSASDLWVTAGSNMAFQLVLRALCDPGDAVIVPVPYYFNHVMAVQLAGAEPQLVDAGPVPDPQRLEAAITPRTRAIISVSPNNPSGVVTPPEVLAEIGRLCARRGLVHLCDEAYAAFTHGAVPHRSPGSAPGSGAHTVTLQSFSKAYGMAGWRLGYAAVPRQLREALLRIQDTLLICPPRPLQRAAVAALEAGPEWLASRLASLSPGRQALLELPARLGRLGLEARLLAEPDGAFYGLLAVACPLRGEELVRRLILEHGVAALPGESFGLQPSPGQALLRLSYGMLRGPELELALERLGQGLLALSRG
ncbi:MAG: aminotransferase class I/II-fold pyridoxal phosphate-dependent enzyme [Synechococcaceae cyanobacterium]|nr:aminotransferase class I/II-fold pyridoxal phosphate-dependent enzyme [Synechococcaceae cyanobacterium]